MNLNASATCVEPQLQPNLSSTIHQPTVFNSAQHCVTDAGRRAAGGRGWRESAPKHLLECVWAVSRIANCTHHLRRAVQCWGAHFSAPPSGLCLILSCRCSRRNRIQNHGARFPVMPNLHETLRWVPHLVFESLRTSMLEVRTRVDSEKKAVSCLWTAFIHPTVAVFLEQVLAHVPSFWGSINNTRVTTT